MLIVCGLKILFQFEIVSVGTYGSVILTLRKCLKQETVLELPELSTFFSKTRFFFFHQGPKRKPFFDKPVCLFKFFARVRNLIDQ